MKLCSSFFIVSILILLVSLVSSSFKPTPKTTPKKQNAKTVKTTTPRVTTTINGVNFTIESNSSMVMINETKEVVVEQRMLATVKTTTTKKAVTTTSTKKPEPKVIPICFRGFSRDGNITCLGDALNQTRPVSEIDCVFPFKFKDVWRDKCIKQPGEAYYWCSVDEIYANRSAKCEQECPFISRELVVNERMKPMHTSCVNTKTGAKGYFPNSKEIELILNTHNEIRSKVDPPAADMRLVSWDFKLARIALRWALNADFQHDNDNARRLPRNRTIPVGQNGFMAINLVHNANSFWKFVIESWGEEIKYFNYGNETMDLMEVGHYTQIIFADAVRVGCAAAQLGKSIFAYCNYAYAQSDYIRPYKNGTSCSDCNEKNCKNNLCTCNKICQNYGRLDPVKCKCDCLPYASGDECENLLCTKTDAEYGCFRPTNPRMCVYSNTIFNCPHLCGICAYKKA